MQNWYDIPFTLLIFTAAGFYIGIKIDAFLKTSIPVFTILCGLTGLAGGIWSIIKRITK